jgi:hypothetical protein
MTWYRVPLVWQIWGIIEIEAESREEAIEKALAKDTPLPVDHNYIEDSEEVDMESFEMFAEEDEEYGEGEEE